MADFNAEAYHAIVVEFLCFESDIASPLWESPSFYWYYYYFAY